MHHLKSIIEDFKHRSEDSPVSSEQDEQSFIHDTHSNASRVYFNTK